MDTENKIIMFFDIDGTLITDHTHILPASAIDAIKQAQANGHLAFVNTGRTYHTMPDIVRSLPFDGFLCGCGTRIIYHGDIIRSQTFTPEEVVFLIDTMDAYHVEAFLEGSEDVYCKRHYRQTMLNKLREEFTREGFCRTAFVEDKNFPFDKFCILTDGQEDIPGFFKAIGHMIDPIDRGHGMFECVPKGVSKASAITEIASILGFSRDQCYAFGDSTNDLPMFEICGHGIAMKEHAPELEPYCDFITDSVEDDGIYKALRKIGII